MINLQLQDRNQKVKDHPHRFCTRQLGRVYTLFQDDVDDRVTRPRNRPWRENNNCCDTIRSVFRAASKEMISSHYKNCLWSNREA